MSIADRKPSGSSGAGAGNGSGNTSVRPVGGGAPGASRADSKAMRSAQKQLMSPEKVQELSDNIRTLNFFVDHGYLQRLSDSDVLPLRDPIPRDGIALLRLSKLVTAEGEDWFEKLISMYAAMYHSDCPMGIIVQSMHGRMSFYLFVNKAIVGDGSPGTNQTYANHLRHLMKGILPGTDIELVSRDERDKLLDKLRDIGYGGRKFVASVSSVPSRRKREADNTQLKISSQGIEKLMDSMDEQNFTLILMANPVSQAEIDRSREGLESMYTMLSPFAKEQVSYSEGESDSTAISLTDSMSESISDTINHSYGTSINVSKSTSKGKNKGRSRQGIFGFGFNSGSCWNTGTSDSTGTNTGGGDSHGTSTQTGSSTGRSDTRGTSTNRSLTLTRDIKAVSGCLERLELEINRINANRSFGMWNCAAYVISDDEDTAALTADSLLALLGGDEQYGGGFVNTWSYAADQIRAASNKENRVTSILSYLSGLEHPVFVQEAQGNTLTATVTPAVMASGRDLPVFLSLPQHSVNGVEVMAMAEFGRNFPAGFNPDKAISFGRLWHMGNFVQTEIRMDLNKFASHCFICGASGSGKSNATYHLLRNFSGNNVKFLVVEPAKGEYKTVFANMDDTQVFTCMPDRYRMLYINPFQFNPQRVTVMEHMARINAVLQSCWPLYGPMPGMLKDAVERAYLRCGWDLQLNRRVIRRGQEFPTMADLLITIEDIIRNSPYPANTKGDYRGALGMRIRSLLTGFEGALFGSARGLTDEELFEHNAIVDLSALGNAETRSLVMGILITRLSEYRKGTYSGNQLRHVTVLEEAHNIFKRCSHEQSADSGNVQGAAVGLLVDSVAEMRSSGEGFLIIDQSPGSVDLAAIKNTAIKIAMRLPEEEDCKTIANALSLTPEQMRELSRLPVGVAAIFHDGWHETVLGKLGQAWHEIKEVRKWAEQPGESNAAHIVWAKSAIVQWYASRLGEQCVDEFASSVSLNSFIAQLNTLRSDKRLNINDPNWADLVRQAGNILSAIQQSGLDLNGEKAYQDPGLLGILGREIRRYMQLDGAFMLEPLSAPSKEDAGMDGVFSSRRILQVRRWYDRFTRLLSEYIVFPVVFSERFRTAPQWSMEQTAKGQCEYLDEARRCIVKSYSDEIRSQPGGDERYWQADMILLSFGYSNRKKASR